MQGSEIAIGGRYALRLKVMPLEPLIEVEVIEKVGRGGRLKIRHLQESPHPGLEEYATSRQIVVPWNDRRALLRDEERLARISEALESQGVDRVRIDAVQTVLSASGEASGFVHSDGRLSIDVAAARRLGQRAGLTETIEDVDPVAFVDRQGSLEMSFVGAERLAREFAAAEPQTVTLFIENEEAEDLATGYAYGERWRHKYLLESRPAFALVRQWAGFDQDLARLRKEIERLQNLIHAAVSDLRRVGAHHEAARIERGLRGQ